MKNYCLIYFLLGLGILVNQQLFAQEEQQEIEKDSIADQKGVKPFQENFFKALSERGIENYEKAIDILIDLESDNETEPAVYFQLGLNYFDIENYKTALNYLEKANTLKPNDYNIKEAIFKVYEQQKQYAKAIDLAKSLSDNNPDYHEILANLYLITKQYQNALSALDKADQSQGFDAHNDQLREVIFKEYNKPEVAVEYYKKRIDQEPYNPLNHYRLISFLISVNKDQEAISASEKALESHPRFTRFYVLQTQIYTRLNQKDNALKALENVITDRFLEEKHKVKAINFFKSYVQNHPDAENDFVEILDLATKEAKDSSSYLDLGLYYFETDKERSLENFKKAKDQNPLDFQILKYVSVLQYQLNQYKEAVNTSNEALEIFPAQAIFMLVKGQALIEQTHYNEAKSVLLEALSYVFEENEMMQKLYESLALVYQGLNQTEKSGEYQIKANAIKEKLN